jgi:Fe-S cluster biosynthesis and repair protein YggX
MTETVFCQRLKREAPALRKAPYPGPLGAKVFAHISQEGWQQWLAHQTMLINENRLSPIDPKAKSYLAEQMEKFLFGEGGDQPVGYVPPT